MPLRAAIRSRTAGRRAPKRILGQAKVFGLKELGQNLKKLAGLGSSTFVGNEVFKIAKEIQSDMRARAPRGATGKTRRSIQAKTFRRPVFMTKAQTTDKRHAYVAVNYRISQGAHNAEFGTYDIRRPTKAKALFIEEYGIFVKSAAPMKATPFFRPTVAAWQGSKYAIAMTHALEKGLGRITSNLRQTGSRGVAVTGRLR